MFAWQGPLFAFWSIIFAAAHLDTFLLLMLCDLSGPTQKILACPFHTVLLLLWPTVVF